MSTSAASNANFTPGRSRRKGWLLVSIAVANFPDRSSSFTVPNSQCSAAGVFRDGGRRHCPCSESDRLRKENTKIHSTAQDEEELLASFEDGDFDIEALEDMFGDELDFVDLEDDEVDLDEEYVDEGGEEEEDYGSDVENDLEHDEAQHDGDGTIGDLDADENFEEDYDEEEVEEDAESETELLMRFVEECHETPIGGLDVSDAEIIREILGNIPLDTERDAESSTTKASYTVEKIFRRFVDEWRDVVFFLENDEKNNDMTLDELTEREQNFRPDAGDFHNTVLAIWKDMLNNDSPDVKTERMWKLFSEQRKYISYFAGKDKVTSESLYPTYRSIEILLESLSRSSDRGVDRKACDIMEEWLPAYGLTPSPGMYSPYIQMVARARHRGAAKKADSILRRAISEYPPNHFESLIGVEVFNAVVTAYAKARGEDDGPARAQELIVFMDGLGMPGCAPNAKTFTSLVDAYAQMNEWESVTEAQAILNNLLNQYLLQEGEGKHLEPSVATWTIVIAAWSRLSKKGRNGAAKRAGDLLRRMDGLSSSGRISAKPDAITYVTTFNAYAYSKFEDEVEEAERLLDEMNELYLDGDDSFKPSVRSIKVLMDAWIKVGVIHRAEQVLKTYEDILEEAENSDSDDDRHAMSSSDWQGIYKSLLIGNVRADNPERATACLNLMIENDDMEPDSMCYERIIESYARLEEDNYAKKTQEIFQLLEKRRQAGAVRPNERVYTCFIRALSKSKVAGLHKKADLILQRMHSLTEGGNPDVEPTIFTYNAVLNAFADSAYIEGTPLKEAFQMSVRVFTQLREEMDADHVTFANMIRCASLLQSDQQKKNKFVTATFKLCCESGNVNNYVIKDLSKVASKDLWKTLTGFSAVSEEDVEVDIEKATMIFERLPSSWKRKTLDRQKPVGNRRTKKSYR